MSEGPVVTDRFSGVIDRVQLLDVVQSACLAGEGRDILVESDFGTSTVRVRSGQAVYCEADSGAGENAIKRVLLWPSGYFRSSPGTAESEQNVHNPWESLLIDAVRFRKEITNSPEDMVSVFSGKITGISLSDLVQLACMAVAERELRLETNAGRGTMFFREGRVFHSECGDLQGEEAFRELLHAESGMFESRLLEGGEKETMTKSLEALLAQGAGGAEEGEVNEEILSTLQKLQRMRTVEKIRAAMTGNQEVRSLLIRESNRMVQLAVIANPRLTESEVALFAGYKHVDDEVLRRIAGNREWMRLIQVRSALVRNAKCPFPISSKILPTLSAADLKSIAMSKSIPAVIAQMAKKMVKVT